MKLPKVRWFSMLTLVLCGLAAVSVGKSALGGSPTVPREADRAKAARTLGGPNDERMYLPEGNWVGGRGVIEPADRETNVAAAVPGRIARVVVVEGARVKAGDPLVLLDAEVEAAQVAAAEADVKQSEAELARQRNGQRPEDRAALSAEARAAEARAKQASGVLERLRKAKEGGAVTGDELDRADKTAAAESATFAAADARQRAAQVGSRYEDVLAADARLVAARARLEEAKARLAQRSVLAPIDAEVLSVKVRAGEYYQPGSGPLLILGDTRTLRARIDVDERDLARIHPKAEVRVRASALGDVELRGTVVEVGRRMGRKNVRSDDPTERNDTKILEVVAALEPTDKLIVGQRVVGFVASAE